MGDVEFLDCDLAGFGVEGRALHADGETAPKDPAGEGGAPAPAPGQRGPRGPVIASWFFAISH